MAKWVGALPGRVWTVLVLDGAKMRLRTHLAPLSAHLHAERERARGRVVRVLSGPIATDAEGHGADMSDVTSETSYAREAAVLAGKGEG